jgi:hypothetical protein
MSLTFARDEKNIMLSVKNFVDIFLYVVTQKICVATPALQGDNYTILNGAYLGFIAKVQIVNYIKNILDDDSLSFKEKENKIFTLSLKKNACCVLVKKGKTFYLLKYNRFLVYYIIPSPLKIPCFIEIKTSIPCIYRYRYEIMDKIVDEFKKILRN